MDFFSIFDGLFSTASVLKSSHSVDDGNDEKVDDIKDNVKNETDTIIASRKAQMKKRRAEQKQIKHTREHIHKR